ncbi:UDP-N-acetylglucosamine 1-carboxyvinyltransferase [Anabaenopsis tanganyikae CS-531]|uniref:UDP-N-acetylglucosamine 1-carboxyvinyltransferase n=2 Tax=Anabaenopsis TaxID=110103 RepID=A0ABT5AVX9_9CYAN|nr:MULTISPECIES: UDP-N-acetylglucosamine 1-carboxyvinyltransferase [Anabaenopsis]MDB9541455.1 UDP-N-acetylglucosamine 1-carboxyvinyltransferase [Anabaenopsis arnoldii]MDH6090434.1 UDP-N-acetylglucosamine 1-carboxyvinyltransferase [Anabaenopsis arnoldii]MDH6105382.1 UDP-N-acetylglucosamine 1-carboxyvinyltransferase [Anabaenopsis tanganyikae CS-531]
MTENLNNLIVHPSRLVGEVRVSGAKNSALRLLAASLLTSAPVRLKNYPSGLLDARLHVEMLTALGKTCQLINQSELEIVETNPPRSELLWSKRSIRNTLLILGALVGRTGRGKVPLPGGCKLGDRKYDIHVMVLESFGAHVWEEEGGYLCAEVPSHQNLRGTEIVLPIRSTGATENSIIIACLAEGITRIWGPHIRPEIQDLIKFLRSMGAKIEVRGQESIIVEGVNELGSTIHEVIADNVEALTWLIGSAVTNGDVEIVDFPFEHLEVPLIHLRESGVRFYRLDNRLIVRGSSCYPIDISTGPYPGINSDMQPLFTVLGAMAKGESRVIDLRFPGRYAYAEELAKMGMNYEVKDNLLVIQGGNKLQGTEVTALDLRAGAALMIAGLVADSPTNISNAWQIYRGYDQINKKLSHLGVSIFSEMQQH